MDARVREHDGSFPTEIPRDGSIGKLLAAVAPVGLDAEGLPIGLQVIAPYMADLSAVHFAGLIAREIPQPKLAA